MYQIINATIPAGTTHTDVNEMTTSTKSTAATKSTATTETTSTSSTSVVVNGDQTSSASTTTDDNRQCIFGRNYNTSRAYMGMNTI